MSAAAWWDVEPKFNGLTYTDEFCGAGGSSIGMTLAGLRLVVALNHDARAIATHSANFPDADHREVDVNRLDMRTIPRTDVLWASPICTELSPSGAKAGPKKQTRGQIELLEHGPVKQETFERTRATFHDVIRATEVHRYEAIIVENVPEVAWKWELFDWWVEGMCRLKPGYNVQFVSVSSAHVGGEDNPHAPQWRNRLYIVFTKAGVPLPDVTPRPLALCTECGEDVRAVQTWKNPRKRKIGKYREQYVYRCPNGLCRHAIVEPYVRPALAAIDLSDLGERIGDREALGKKQLVPNTMARIRLGMQMFAYPGAALVPAGGTWNTRPTSIAEPMCTRLANEKGFEALAVAPPFLTILRNNQVAASLDDPLSTITTSGHHHYLTVPPGQLPTLAPDAFVIPYRKGRPRSVHEPLHTLATKDSGAVIQPAIAIEDVRYRMLKPRENLRGQRFPDTYVVTGNEGEQTMQAGNAVSSNVAQWLGAQVAAVLCGRRPGAAA